MFNPKSSVWIFRAVCQFPHTVLLGFAITRVLGLSLATFTKIICSVLALVHNTLVVPHRIHEFQSLGFKNSRAKEVAQTPPYILFSVLYSMTHNLTDFHIRL